MSNILEYSPALGRLVTAPSLSGSIGSIGAKLTPAQRRAAITKRRIATRQAALQKRAVQKTVAKKIQADKAAKAVAAKKVREAKLADIKAKREQTLKAKREAMVKKAQAVKAARLAAQLERSNILKLQNAIRRLAIAVKDNALRIGLDGKNGPRTTAATNLALSKYVSAATPALKTGRLTIAEVSRGAAGFAPLIDAEAKKRVAAKIKIVAASEAARKRLPAKSVIRSKTIVRKARQGDKNALRAVAKVAAMANAGNPTAKAAQAVMREEAVSSPPESIQEAITEQSEEIAEGESSAFVPSSNAVPEAAEYDNDLAESTEMVSEGQAEDQADAESADLFEQVDESAAEATDAAFSDKETSDFPEGEGESLQDFANELPAVDESELVMSSEDAATMGADPTVLGFSLKKTIKKTERGIKRGAKTIGRVPIVKQVVAAHAKVAKLSLKGIEALGKNIAEVAATPIKLAIRTPATRRARYLAYKASRGRTKTPSKTQRTQAALWTLAQLNRRGPLGKLGVSILKFAYGKQGGVGYAGSEDILVGCCAGDVSTLGAMTGAEIAAIASSVVAVISAMTKLLDKPNLAPANLPETVQNVSNAAEAFDNAAEAFEG